VKARSPAPSTLQDPATDAARQAPLVGLLTELLQGYRRPAIAITDKGSIVCSSPAAMRGELAGGPERHRPGPR